jgi:molybdopterin synthase catalytic subunit
VEGPIDPAFIAESIAKHSTQARHRGARDLFRSGDGRTWRTVRAEDLPPVPAPIQYTAYRDMANEQMTAIREEAFARWPITCLHVHHSQGIIKAGELCFFVFASSRASPG